MLEDVLSITLFLLLRENISFPMKFPSGNGCRSIVVWKIQSLTTDYGTAGQEIKQGTGYVAVDNVTKCYHLAMINQYVVIAFPH